MPTEVVPPLLELDDEELLLELEDELDELLLEEELLELEELLLDVPVSDVPDVVAVVVPIRGTFCISA